MINQKDVYECLIDLIGPDQFTVASGRRFKVNVGSKEAVLYLYPSHISGYVLRPGGDVLDANSQVLHSLFEMQDWLITNLDL